MAGAGLPNFAEAGTSCDTILGDWVCLGSLGLPAGFPGAVLPGMGMGIGAEGDRRNGMGAGCRVGGEALLGGSSAGLLFPCANH